MVTFSKSTKWAIIFVGIGVAAGVGITTALFQQRAIQQTEVVYDNDNPWFDPSFIQSQQAILRTGAYYKSILAIGEEGFFYAEAKGGEEPYQFEWKFSDGVVLIGQNSTRSFDSPGQYSAQLTVSDSEGRKQSNNISMRVE